MCALLSLFHHFIMVESFFLLLQKVRNPVTQLLEQSKKFYGQNKVVKKGKVTHTIGGSYCNGKNIPTLKH